MINRTESGQSSKYVYVYIYIYIYIQGQAGLIRFFRDHDIMVIRMTMAMSRVSSVILMMKRMEEKDTEDKNISKNHDGMDG